MAAPINSTQKSRVFIRWRPLVGLELERGDAEFIRTTRQRGNKFSLQIVQDESANCLQENKNFNFGAGAPRLRKRKRGDFNGKSFDGVVEADHDNEFVFRTCVQPLIDETVLPQGGIANCFAYGQTGSGKTHTMLGYGDEEGLYSKAARYLFQFIDEFNATLSEEDEENQLKLHVRLAELYNGRLYNLLNERKRCQMLEDKKGVSHMRSSVTNKETKRTYSNFIAGRLCSNIEEIESAISSGIELRASGVSSAHDESSRSHAIIEFEIVSKRIMELRAKAVHWEAEETYWTYHFYTPSKVQKARRALSKVNAEIKRLSTMDAAPFALGRLVFCDLAGAEVGSGVVKIGDEFVETGQRQKQTAESRREAIEINKSLAALAACLRDLNKRKSPSSRVPYRESTLTQLLKQYLDGTNCGTVMVANVSPSIAYKKLTVQTLRYANMLGSISDRRAEPKRAKKGSKTRVVAPCTTEESQQMILFE